MSEQINQPTSDITAVRTALFDALRGLSDKDKPMDIDRAKAIAEVAQTIINSAKVEVDALRVIGGTGTGFIPALPPPKSEPKPALQNLRDKGIVPPEPVRPGITHPMPGYTVHRMRG
jgi:hypothetical protein